MGKSIAGKGKSTQNIAIFSIKSTSSLHLPHLFSKKKIQNENRRARKPWCVYDEYGILCMKLTLYSLFVYADLQVRGMVAFWC